MLSAGFFAAVEAHHIVGFAGFLDDAETACNFRIGFGHPAHVTPEAVRPLLDKEIDGFSVVFHMISYQSVGVSTLQSRALAGIAGGTYLFAIPGSMGAVKDAWNGVLKAEFDATHKPCNLVEILPV